MVIFQDSITKKLDTCTFNSLPDVLLLVGDRGCGRHTLIGDISEKFKLDVMDITSKLTFENISEYVDSPISRLYFIDCDKVDVKGQNIILKFLEEALPLSKIVLITTNTETVLDTVLNRCTIWRFEPYSKESLRSFTDNESVLKYANTPGKVLEYSKYDLEGLRSLCDLIFTAITKASVPNALTLSAKVAWKSGDDGYPKELFLSFLLDSARQFIIANQDSCLAAYTLTAGLFENSMIPRIDCRRLFENYIVELKSAMEGVSAQ